MVQIFKVPLSGIEIKFDKILFYNPNQWNELLRAYSEFNPGFETRRKLYLNKKKPDFILFLALDQNYKLLNHEDVVFTLIDKGVLNPNEYNALSTDPRNGKYVFTDWNYIYFMDKRYSFQMPGKPNIIINNQNSKALYQNIKPFYNFHAFPYIVTFEDDNPIDVNISDTVFNCLDLGALLRQIKDKSYWSNKILLGKITKLMDTISAKKVVTSFKGFLNVDKSYYFKCLSELQDVSTNIKVLLEPQFWKTSLSGYDISFLYTIKGKHKVTAIWESIETKKATFIFTFNTPEAYNKGINSFISCLNDPKCFHGRDALRDFGIDHIKKNYIHRIFHNPKIKEDTNWKTNLSKYI